MIGFIATRLLTLLPVLWGVSVVVFLLIHLIPGDALQLFLGTQVALTPAQMEELRRLFGLNKSLPLQYLDWIGGANISELPWKSGSLLLAPCSKPKPGERSDPDLPFP